MSKKHMIQILGELAELISPTGENSKIVLMPIDSFNYGLLFFSVGTCRISFLKLGLHEFYGAYSGDIFKVISEEKSLSDIVNIYLLNVFCLPFILLDIVNTCKNIWAVGQENVLDLKPYIESALRNDEKNDSMDTDEIEVFSNKFEVYIHVHQLDVHSFHTDDTFISCTFMDYGFIVYRKNSDKNIWQFELVLKKNPSSESNTIPILDIPMSLHKNSTVTDFAEGQTYASDPVVVFIHHSDHKSIILQSIFGITCSPSSILCLAGHPNGNLMWTFCSFGEKVQSSLNLQTLFTANQPLTGIHFVENIKGSIDSEFLLIVGLLGQITFFSSKNFPSFSIVTANHPFWTLTVHLNSSIKESALAQNYLLHTSFDGTLWITDLPTLLNRDMITEELCLPSRSSELCSVDQIVVLDPSRGSVLLKTSSGHMYLAMFMEETEFNVVTSSLPSLMNACLQQSIVMQELVHTKALQSKLFAALSTFASLKFGALTVKEPITYSITEVNLEPKKYILMINLKFLEELNLNPELCHVNASVFTYFQEDFTLVSHTVPYNPDQGTLCLELVDSVLQSSFISIFPLFVEIGIILQLPDDWKKFDCFKIVSSCLPLYHRIKSFMIHELHLFKKSSLCLPQSTHYKTSMTSSDVIKKLGMQRPISNLMQIKSKKDPGFPLKLNLSLSLSSVEEMMKSTGEIDACQFIHQLLFQNNQSHAITQEDCVTSNKFPLSVSVRKSNNAILINLMANSFQSLVGLRIAIMDALLAISSQNTCSSKPSAYLNIPASIYRRCEEISNSLMKLYGKDVASPEVTDTIVQLYQELRKDVSGKLPVF